MDKQNKYHSRKVMVNGIKFDSKKEAKRFQELSLLQKAGKIQSLERQVRYLLIPSQYAEVKGKRKCIERPCYYVADFVYLDAKNNLVVEDTKGFRTKDYVIKRKLMLQEYGIRIKEI